MADHADANRAHFDTVADSYDSTHGGGQIQHKILHALLAVPGVEWDDETTSLLEFACGTGLMSQKLAQYVQRIVGIDISARMVDVFNGKARNQGIPEDEMSAYAFDLLQHGVDAAPVPLRAQFDVVVVSMAYHHLPDIAAATATLAACLRPGGWLLVVDLLWKAELFEVFTAAKAARAARALPEDLADSEYMRALDTVSHVGGIRREDALAALESAGLTACSVTQALSIDRELPARLVPAGVDVSAVSLPSADPAKVVLRFPVFVAAGQR
ncbi:S-adenosyl-L-methionine-dependent methyltransferase [Dipodascopsis tothii]|uniref:S-adenosyl-L-methionine-dependent methyltransferase n=1 Tax=Dipodascopsis tothii TaxID=44089 RepID=UPI0034CD6C7F